MTQKNPKIYKKTHHHILLCMPTASLNSLEHNPFEVLDKSNLYDDLTDETIDDMYEKINTWSGNDEKSLLLIDDMTASLKGSKHIQDILKRMIYNRRHLKLNIIITAQSYVNIPLDVRKNIQNLILFKPTKKQFQIVFDELLENKKDAFYPFYPITCI